MPLENILKDAVKDAVGATISEEVQEFKRSKQMPKRILIFSPITQKWEIGRTEKNSVTGADQWVREDGSWICKKGDEIATAPLPPNPSKR